jgi:hypothetical protein
MITWQRSQEGRGRVNKAPPYEPPRVTYIIHLQDLLDPGEANGKEGQTQEGASGLWDERGEGNPPPRTRRRREEK